MPFFTTVTINGDYCIRAGVPTRENETGLDRACAAARPRRALLLLTVLHDLAKKEEARLIIVKDSKSGYSE